MKLHFEPNLDYQLQAIEAVCDLFPEVRHFKAPPTPSLQS